MSDQTKPSRTEQRAVVDQILTTMANISLLPEQPMESSVFFRETPLASMLTYSSPADQVLILQCSQELGFALAAKFFDRPLPVSPDDDDVTDTMTELINMIGGNLKALMPEEPAIGIPCSLHHGEIPVKVNGQLNRLWFETTSGAMCLTFAKYSFA